MKRKFSILCDVTFLVGLQGKFDIDQSERGQLSWRSCAALRLAQGHCQWNLTRHCECRRRNWTACGTARPKFVNYLIVLLNWKTWIVVWAYWDLAELDNQCDGAWHSSMSRLDWTKNVQYWRLVSTRKADLSIRTSRTDRLMYSRVVVDPCRSLLTL